MPSHTMSQAKNSIGRTLWSLVDKQPTDQQKDAVWAYFGSQCAYCGVQLSKADRKGHLDHLDAKRVPGHNHISNRVLARETCNSDEKRETDWEKFLALKCGDDQAAYVIRHSKIIEWRNQCGAAPATDPAIIAQVQASIATLNAALEQEANRIKRML